MNRCLVCLIFSLGCSAALAQSGRDADRNSGVVLIVPEDTMATGDGLGRVFPPNARRGVMRVVAWPEVLLDGKPERLSPGARIRDTPKHAHPTRRFNWREFGGELPQKLRWRTARRVAAFRRRGQSKTA